MLLNKAEFITPLAVSQFAKQVAGYIQLFLFIVYTTALINDISDLDRLTLSPMFFFIAELCVQIMT